MISSVTTLFLFFLLWAATEGIQQSLVLVALNWTWRAGYLASADASTRSELALHIRGCDAISDGRFFFLLIAFILANVCHSVGVWDRGGLSRTISVFIALAARLGLASLLTSYGGGVLPASVISVLYPTIQPAGRFLTGVWLWRWRSEERA
jgi:hypothetical protein